MTFLCKLLAAVTACCFLPIIILQLRLTKRFKTTIISFAVNEAWLSLVERCVRDAEVVGSNPVASIPWQGHRRCWNPVSTGFFYLFKVLFFTRLWSDFSKAIKQAIKVHISLIACSVFNHPKSLILVSETSIQFFGFPFCD